MLHNLLLFVLLALMCALAASQAEEATGEEAAPGASGESERLELAEVRKLRLKDIRSRLAARGLECRGCAEKDDYAALYVCPSLSNLSPLSPLSLREYLCSLLAPTNTPSPIHPHTPTPIQLLRAPARAAQGDQGRCGASCGRGGGPT